MLPDDLRDAIDTMLPPRWSRNNPVDCAGGETRDTIPEVMELIAAHPDVARDRLPGPRHPVEPGPDDARGPLLPGLRARAHRRLPRAPGRPLRRGRRRAQSRATGKPILTATELAVADPATPVRRRSGPPAGSATRAATAPSPPSVTSIATPATGRDEDGDRRRRRPLNPVLVLAVAGPGPALLLLLALEVGGGPSRGLPTPPPPTSVAPPAPSPTLTTPLLSFRRAPGVLSRDVNSRPSGSASTEFAALARAPSCVDVAVDGVAVGSAAPTCR